MRWSHEAIRPRETSLAKKPGTSITGAPSPCGTPSPRSTGSRRSDRCSSAHLLSRQMGIWSELMAVTLRHTPAGNVQYHGERGHKTERCGDRQHLDAHER